MADVADPVRPELTMPAAEAGHLAEVYAGAAAIPEYGSGGSTVLAAEMPGKRVVSVESDKAWAGKMRRWFAAHPPAEGAKVEIVWSDIGPTKDWGQPADQSGWKRFPRYPLGVWQRDGFEHPDVVLVDGRFRVGCVLATAYSIARPVTVLFDDYANRDRHHGVEEFVGAPARIVGRMAEFRLEPRAVPAVKLLQIVRYMLRP